MQNKRRDSFKEKNIDLSFDFVSNNIQTKVFDTGKLTKSNIPTKKEEKKKKNEDNEE